MTIEIIIIIGFLLFIVLIQVLFFLKNYKKPTPLKALIVYGKIDAEDSVPFKIYTTKSTFVIPVIQNYYFLELDQYSITTEIESFKPNKTKANFKIECLVSPDKNELDKIVDLFFMKTKNEIENLLSQSIRLQIEKFISMSSTKLNNENNYTFEIEEKVKELLAQNGFSGTETISVKI